MTIEFVSPSGKRSVEAHLATRQPRIGEEVQWSYEEEVEGETRTRNVAGTVDKVQWTIGRTTGDHRVVVQLR